MMHLEKNRMDTSRQTASHYCRMKQKTDQIPPQRMASGKKANGEWFRTRYSLFPTRYSLLATRWN